ncbi:MAG TPA: CinA family protein, partial [Spirochaetota bacterium]|nr:CinA family protein [Spirochaetota bacterium]
IHLTKFVKSDAEKQEIYPIISKAEKIFKDNGFFYTDDEDLSSLVLKTLINKNKTLSFAESITGGNVSGEFVKNPSASKVLNGGVVVYSNELKKSLLGVKEETLNKFGAVSEQTVTEMCYGLKKLTGSDINISISGIAGPDGGSKEKPVGLVYFGFMFDDKLIVKKEVFNYGNRQRIISRCINYVYYEILKNYL